MKVGVSLFAQNYVDWDRFEAEEGGAAGSPQPIHDAQIYREQFHLGRLVEPLGFNSLWTVEHHFTPYTMINNPTQFLAYFAGCTERIDMGTMVVGAALARSRWGGRGLRGARPHAGRPQPEGRHGPRPRHPRVQRPPRADGPVARALQGGPRRAARGAEGRVVRASGPVPPDPAHHPAPPSAARTPSCSTTSTSPGAAPRRCRWRRTRTASRCSSRSGSGRITRRSSASTTASASRSTAGSRSGPPWSAGSTAPRPTRRQRKARASTSSSTPTAPCATTSSSASTCRG